MHVHTHTHIHTHTQTHTCTALATMETTMMMMAGCFWREEDQAAGRKGPGGTANTRYVCESKVVFECVYVCVQLLEATYL